jgi:hypothetical protein
MGKRAHHTSSPKQSIMGFFAVMVGEGESERKTTESFIVLKNQQIMLVQAAPCNFRFL